MYSSYHVCFIESHEAPAAQTTLVPDEPLTTDEPPTVKEIAQGANSAPIFFNGEEEEEFLPANPRQPIPDDPPHLVEQILDDPPDLTNHADNPVDYGQHEVPTIN